MDPNTLLHKLRTAVAETRTALDGDAPDDLDAMVMGDPLEDAAKALMDAALNLDEWLTLNGPLPDAWKKPEPTADLHRGTAAELLHQAHRYSSGEIQSVALVAEANVHAMLSVSLELAARNGA